MEKVFPGPSVSLLTRGRGNEGNMIHMPATSIWVVAEKALNSSFSRPAESGRAGLEKVRHPLRTCPLGRWNANSKHKFQRLGNGRGDCNRSFVSTNATIANIEKDAPVPGDFLRVQEVSFRPPGTQVSLLDKVSMSLPEKSLGLVYGPSGSGKTTLLQVLGGLAKPSEGSIYLGKDGTDISKKPAGPLSLSARVGIVFQFPERFAEGYNQSFITGAAFTFLKYFLTDTIVDELLFGYSRQTQDQQLRHTLTIRLQMAIIAVGLSGMPLDMNPRALSDGYKRRLALAVQLVRLPDVMLLDEPLAGLDWKARADVVRLLSAVKKEKTLIVVSHDLRELSGLVDKSWQMEMGGKLTKTSQ